MSIVGRDEHDKRGQIMTQPHEHRCDNCDDILLHDDLSESCWEFDNHIRESCKALDEALT